MIRRSALCALTLLTAVGAGLADAAADSVADRARGETGARTQDPQRPQSRPASRPTSRPATAPDATGPQAADPAQPERTALPPIAEPFRSRIERRDLLQQHARTSPIEGFWELTSVRRAGVTSQMPRGYVSFGREHMVLHVAAIPAPSATPWVQSSVRRYRIEGDQLVTTTLSGHEYGGKLLVEQPGRVETRRIEQAGTVLRIHQAGGAYMEFVRVE